MASDILQRRHAAAESDAGDEFALPSDLVEVLQPIASLKVTVGLMAVAIFLILAGTLAQIDKDIWAVMAEYFRTPVAWVELPIFFPRDWNIPDVAFPFPGGFAIGGAMLVNLLAAHFLRFKVQARGARLFAGLAGVAAGAAMTWFVVASGSNSGGLQDSPLVEWGTLWSGLKVGLAALWLLLVGSLFMLDANRRLERIGVAISAAVCGALLVWLYFVRNDFELSASSLRILWQLLKGGLAGLVLLAGCVLLFRKRAGIVLLHGGIALIMINELVVYCLHTEGTMQIKEGETVNYAQDMRTVELAIVDHHDPREDDVVVVPRRLLAAGGRISDPALPFDIKVVNYMQNSDLHPVKPGEENLADTGTGLQLAAQEMKPGAGTDVNSKVDISSAYIQLLDKEHGDKPLGTYLVGVLQSLRGVPETVDVDGRQYEVSLRFKRDYKPYSMHLIDGRFDRYMGTEKAKNFSSDLRLVDPPRNVDREVHIWMNNPLRYGGETFYQSQMDIDPATGREFTGLSVVVNAGWMIPYVACMIVATGMLAHFSIVLGRFLNRRRAAALPAAAKVSAQRKQGAARAVPAGSEQPASIFDWAVPAGVVFLGAMLIYSVARSHPVGPGDYDFASFGRLPVVYEGRMKPLDTLARNSLRVISDSESYKDEKGKRQPAVKWLLDLISNSAATGKAPIVRIQNLEVLDMLGLGRREGFRYSIEEIRGGLKEFEKQEAAARAVPAGERSVFEVKVLELASRLRMIMTLSDAFDRPPIRPEHVAEDLVAAVKRQQREAQAGIVLPLAIPPAAGEGDWETYAAAWTKAYAQVSVLKQQPNEATMDFSRVVEGYATQKPEEFNKSVSDYQTWLTAHPPQEYDAPKMDFETLFNRARPFLWCSWLYVAAFALAAIGWLVYWRPLNRAALALVVFTFALHTMALVARIYISGRPPVTNLYSAAIFVGWGGVLLGLVLETVYRLGIGNIIAAAAGFSTLVIADRLAADGDDTFIVLQAVLDTQFWLATHVTCITFGYATTFIAGLLGMLYILAGVLTPSLTGERRKALPRMIYGTVCFSIFFSFVGTVLGGLWADDSWGRFWGWDPKENGALIIVLWNALVLHARWDGMIRDRGLAILTVLGNIAVAWSAFGVNQLSVGLHAYGHTDGVTLALVIFALSQLVLVGLALVPKRYWLSAEAA